MTIKNNVVLLPVMGAKVEAETKDDENIDKTRFSILSEAVFTSVGKKYIWQCTEGEVHKVHVIIGTPYYDVYIEISAADLPPLVYNTMKIKN